MLQVYDAGDVFGIMQYQQADEEEDGENEEEEKKNGNPGAIISSKVVVTQAGGLQSSEPTRWGRQCHAKKTLN